MDFKKIWQNMAGIGPSVGILTFFKQALISAPYLIRCLLKNVGSTGPMNYLKMVVNTA